jgi:hypothetical protein
MMKINCWEFKECGRELNGTNVDELGVCPAALTGKFDGVNDGECGGRFCWAVTDTLRNGKTQGTFADKLKHCLQCDFLQFVHQEQGRDFVLTPLDLKKSHHSFLKE